MNKVTKKAQALLSQLPAAGKVIEITNLELVPKFWQKNLTADKKRNRFWTVTFYQDVLVHRLLLFGKVEYEELVTGFRRWERSEDGQMFEFYPEALEAAWKIVSDWVRTGGAYAAKIGEPLE
jgi:hypothetical protein